MRSTRFVTSVGPSSGVRTMANSSPPSRATTSVCPTHRRSREATALNNSSPTGWPSVIDAFEFVNIDIQNRKPLAASELAFQPVLEKRPVGQIGQRIIVRHVRDPLVRPFPLGDI